jgi:hypothetical protein
MIWNDDYKRIEKTLPQHLRVTVKAVAAICSPVRNSMEYISQYFPAFYFKAAMGNMTLTIYI